MNKECARFAQDLQNHHLINIVTESHFVSAEVTLVPISRSNLMMVHVLTVQLVKLKSAEICVGLLTHKSVHSSQTRFTMTKEIVSIVLLD